MAKNLTIFRSVSDPNDKSESNIKLSIQICQRFLVPLGILPINSNIIPIQKCLSKISIVICSFLLFFIFIPTLLYTVIDAKHPKIKVKLYAQTVFSVAVITKYYLLITKNQKISKCLNHISIDWRSFKKLDDHNIMYDYAKYAQFIMIPCAGFMYGGGFFYQAIAPLSRGKILTARNVSRYLFPSPIYSGLFTADQSPYYEIVFVTQLCSSFVRYSINVATCSLAVVLVLHVCGQLQLVMTRLEHFIDKENTEIGIKYKISEIVNLHLRSLSFIVCIEEILNKICLVDVLGSTISICATGYFFLAELEKEHTKAIDMLTYTVLFISFTFNIFIFCYIGEMLTQQSQKVGIIAYMTNWYELSVKDAKILILVLSITNHGNAITAGKMAKLSYRSFFSIFKTAFAYLNFLRTFM